LFPVCASDLRPVQDHNCALNSTKCATTAHVTINVGGIIATSSITNTAVDDLKLTAGKDAYAVVKPLDVMIGVDWSIVRTTASGTDRPFVAAAAIASESLGGTF
jgi:molybdopterin-binding protein